jgi:glucose-1-phosphate thymidylyltransferase
MKGIVLAGGTGSRLWPITRSVSKQLLPIYDKPMVYYPLSTLMLADIREILIITTPHDQSQFKDLLGDGSEFGVSLQYLTQPEPKGLAQALIIGEEFLGGESCLMILGDNIFHGAGLGRDLIHKLPTSGAHIFTYEVANPSDYGVLEISQDGLPVSITEKPTEFISNLAVTGIYFFDGQVSGIARNVQPSQRGEMEITSVIDHYLNAGTLSFTHLSRGSAWLDTGNPDSLNDAAAFVKVIEDRTGLKIACLEEIAFINGWINELHLEKSVEKYGKSQYGVYLKKVLSSKEKWNINHRANSVDYLFHLVDKKTESKSTEESIAVVIPVFRPSEIFFPQTLKSLSLQIEEVKEYIFVFDGWFEEWAELEILRYFPKALVIKLENNLGQGSARNIGVKQSSSKWIAFVDQDDLWDPNHLSNLINGSKNGDFSLGYSDIQKIDKNNMVLVESMMDATVTIGKNSLIKKNISDLLFRDLMIFPSSAIVDRVKFLEVGGFAEVLKGHEDDFGFRKLLQKYPNHFFSKSISASWRSHNSGTSASLSMSESRLGYAKLLFTEFEDDAIIKAGISDRLSSSFLRELIAITALEDSSQFFSYRENCLAFLKIAKQLRADVKFRYKAAFSLSDPRVLLLSAKTYKFLKSRYRAA